jgi:hypothetical protein
MRAKDRRAVGSRCCVRRAALRTDKRKGRAKRRKAAQLRSGVLRLASVNIAMLMLPFG